MTTEDRLRRAITDRTDHVEPAPGGLNAIEETLMQPTPMSPRNKWMMGGAAAVVVALVAVAAIALTKDDDAPQGVATDPAVTTTVAPQVTVTTDPPSDTATTPPPATTPIDAMPSVVDPSSVVWPRPGHDARFDDPVDAARSFAVFYAGFTNPTTGPFTKGGLFSGGGIPSFYPDHPYGSVDIRPTDDPNSPVTTVLVMKMGDDRWYVLGAGAPDLELGWIGVEGSGVIGCPGTVSIAGSVLAFEGHVDLRIDSFGADGSRTEIGRGFATGSGVPPAAPFQADVACDAAVSAGPGTGADTGGVIMAWDTSAEDGRILAVAVKPVAFTP